MTSLMYGAEFFLLAWLVFVVIGATSTAMTVRVFGGHVARWEPRTRHRALVLLATLPLLTAAALMVSAILPSIVSLEFPRVDHCTLHNDAHPHLCFLHMPKMGMKAAFIVLLVVVMGYAFFCAAFAAVRVLRALRILRLLAMSGEARRDLGVTIIETSQPLCLAAGLLRPRVLLSRGLLDTLNQDQRAIVLAHEHAHVRRRDALIATVVRMLAMLHFPAVARWLVREVDVAAEQVCDEEAGRVVGDRVAVASAILAVERVAQHAAAAQLAAVAVAFGQRAAERRVQALLVEPGAPRSLVTVGAGLGLAATGVLAASGELHHLIESLLSSIAY